MRTRFVDCDYVDVGEVKVNEFQAGLIQHGITDAGAIVDVTDYKRDQRLDAVVENYKYDEDAEEIMESGLEFI